jgi:hypothetical protein
LAKDFGERFLNILINGESAAIRCDQNPNPGPEETISVLFPSLAMPILKIPSTRRRLRMRIVSTAGGGGGRFPLDRPSSLDFPTKKKERKKEDETRKKSEDKKPASSWNR